MLYPNFLFEIWQMIGISSSVLELASLSSHFTKTSELETRIQQLLNSRCARAYLQYSQLFCFNNDETIEKYRQAMGLHTTRDLLDECQLLVSVKKHVPISAAVATSNVLANPILLQLLTTMQTLEIQASHVLVPANADALSTLSTQLFTSVQPGTLLTAESVVLNNLFSIRGDQEIEAIFLMHYAPMKNQSRMI